MMVNPESTAAARALNPIHERQSLGGVSCSSKRADPRELAGLGNVRTPSIADLLVSSLGESTGRRYHGERTSGGVKVRPAMRRGCGGPLAPFGLGTGRSAGNDGRIDGFISRPRLPAAVFLCGFVIAWLVPRRYSGIAGGRRGASARLLAAPYHMAYRFLMLVGVGGRSILLCRCAARGRRRPHGHVLEVAAGLGSRHRARQGSIPIVLLPLLVFAKR